jgi:UDP-N-acetyl-D-mannosaminuronic acid transferase (WecB/TagA/CpsF family)
VGALFDYIAGTEERSPDVIDSMGLEWLWRLMLDPRGKWKRYMIGNPVFIYHLIKQKTGSTQY